MFESPYCRVTYLEGDKAVYLAWKGFCRGGDYRRPTMYALSLLKECSGSDFIIDARNGFEDDPVDVEWGFKILLPAMGKTGCARCVMIMNEVNDIEGEMDMWTREFKKYFQVLRVSSLEEALERLKKARE